MPLDVDFESLRYRGASRERCYELFSRLAFRTLVNEYAPTARHDPEGLRAGHDARGARRADRRAARRRRVRGARHPRPPVGDARGDRRHRLLHCAIDRRATCPLGHEGAIGGGDLLAGADAGAGRPPRGARAAEAAARGRESIRKVGHDLKFDLVVLQRHGIALRGLAFDSMLASYLLDATRPGHPLEETSLEHLGYKALTEEDVCGRGAKAMPLSRARAGGRAELRRRTRRPRAAAVEPAGAAARHRRSSTRSIASSRCRCCRCWRDVERAGIRIDGPALAAQSQHIERELARGSARIFELAGEEFNVNSPKQLGEILFDKLQLPALKKTGKTRSASTAVEVLEELALDARAAAADSRMARPAQAEEHLHRRAAAARASATPAACTPASTRRSPPPGA